MKHYQVLDLQGGNFMSDTYGNPQTANQGIYENIL